MTQIDDITIGDIVTVDAEAEFSSIVRLDAYDNPQQNLALLRSYLFSGTAPDSGSAAVRAVSSVKLLELIVDSFIRGPIPAKGQEAHNAFIAIANYGHGKSHFGLALANYFGREPDSSELKRLLPKIENALNNASLAQRLRDFKKTRGSFLVVRMSGDKPGSLRQQFVRNLEVAIDENSATAGQRPAFWYTTAERVLSQLSDGEVAEANEYLGTSRSTELGLLINDIKQRKDVYDLCVELLTYLHGYPPDLGGEAGLESIVDWAATTLCGDGKPFGGMVILMDEFSAFLQKYAQRSGAMEMQTLLNGVAKHQGNAVFLALGQNDPITLAQSLPLPPVQITSLQKELERITKKYALYSLMESVIDSYLQQEDYAWNKLLEERKVQGSIYRATNVAFEQFKLRYESNLRWSLETFQETVTKGCFPLHPVTTALLCNLQFGAADGAGTPRTVLGFVLEELNEHTDQPALIDGQLQWVLPIKLVEYFETRLQGDVYQAYIKAVRLLQEEAPIEHERILKALLLQDVANVKARGDDQVNFLAQSSGVPYDETKLILRTLTESKCIQYNAYHRINSFWEASNNANVLEELIATKISSIFAQGNNRSYGELEDGLKLVAQTLLEPIAMAVQWGESSDWAVRQRVLTIADFGEDELPNLVSGFAATLHGLQDGDRGIVVWLPARTDDDVTWYRNNLTRLVDRAIPGESPIPLLFVLPTEPSPALFERYLRIQALNEFSQSEIEDAGHDMYVSERARVQADLIKAFGVVRGENDNCADLKRAPIQFVVPIAYRHRVQSMPSLSLRGAMRECYAYAYRSAPPEFRTDWKASRKSLKDATQTVCSLLLQNSPKSLRDGVAANSPAKDICEKFLMRSWQLLGSDYRIQEPESQSVRRGWDFLGVSFAAGTHETQLRPVLIALLNPPHGYDYNTVTLLFCAWYGYHSHDIQLSTKSGIIGRERLISWLARGPKEFINELCITQNVAIARRDRGELDKEVNAILEKMKSSTLSQDDAQKALSHLLDYAGDERISEERRQLVSEAAATLNDGCEQARKYDDSARRLQSEIVSGRDIQSLIALQDRVNALPRPTLVQTTGPSATALRDKAIEKIGDVVDSDCQRYEKVALITQVGQFEQNLKTGKLRVQNAGLAELVERYDVALRKLAENTAALKIQESEKSVRAAIAATDAKDGLKRLYEHREYLENLEGYSEATMEARRQKLKAIDEEIARLERDAETWPDAMTKLLLPTEVARMREYLLRVSGRYSGSPYEQDVTNALSQTEQLGEFFAAFQRVDFQTRPSSIATPGDVAAAASQIGELAARFAPLLSSEQQRRIAEVRDRLQQADTNKREQAMAWMCERQNEYNTGRNPTDVLIKLREVPAFLPSEAKVELDEFIEQVNLRVHRDTVAHIEHEFRTLSSRVQREECLALLHLVLEEA